MSDGSDQPTLPAPACRFTVTLPKGGGPAPSDATDGDADGGGTGRTGFGPAPSDATEGDADGGGTGRTGFALKRPITVTPTA